MNAFNPNIDNLKKYVSENGDTVKSFKKLCEILEITYSSKRIERKIELLSPYVQLSRLGNSIKVIGFHDKPTYLPSRKSKYKSNIAIVLQYLFDEKNTMFIEGLASELIAMFGFYDDIVKDLLVAMNNHNSDTWISILSHVTELKDEYLKGAVNSVDEINLIKKLLGSARKNAYEAMENSLKSLKEDELIYFSKGYCLLSKNSETHIYEGNKYYFEILDCEQEVLNTINKNRYNRLKAKHSQYEVHDLEMYQAKIGHTQDFYTGLLTLVNQTIQNIEKDKAPSEKSPIYKKICPIYQIIFGNKYRLSKISFDEYQDATQAINESLVKKVFDEYKNGPEVPDDFNDDENLQLFASVTSAEGLSRVSEKFDSYPKDMPYIDRLRKLCKDEGLFVNENLEIIQKRTMHNDADLGLYQLLMILILCHSKEFMLSELKARKQMQKDIKNGKFCLDKPLKKIPSKIQ